MSSEPSKDTKADIDGQFFIQLDGKDITLPEKMLAHIPAEAGKGKRARFTMQEGVLLAQGDIVLAVSHKYVKDEGLITVYWMKYSFIGIMDAVSAAVNENGEITFLDLPITLSEDGGVVANTDKDATRSKCTITILSQEEVEAEEKAERGE